MRIDGCFCGETLSCDFGGEGGGSAGGGGGGAEPPGFRIAYTFIDTYVHSCGPLCDSDACLALEGSCDAPPDVFFGSHLFQVGHYYTLPAEAEALTPDTCWNIPPLPDGSLICRFDGAYRSMTTGEACVPERVSPWSSIELTVSEPVSCEVWPAGCTIRRDGSQLTVTPRSTTCDCPTCGACDEPTVRSFRCTIPPLEVGEYTVSIGDRSFPMEVSDTGIDNATCLLAGG